MQSRINPPRLTRVVALTFVAILVFASASYAQLFPELVTITQPKVTFDVNGVTAYDPVGQVLSIKATTTALQGASAPPCIFAPPPLTVPPTFTFNIGVQVDNSGALVGGVFGDDLVIMGGALDPLAFPEFICNPPGPGSINLAAVLMRGTVQEFGYLNDPDQFVFRFSLDGGEFYRLGVREVAVKFSLETTPDDSTFTGRFDTGFVGKALGDAGVLLGLLAPGPTVTTSNLLVGAPGPGGAIATFTATASGFRNPSLGVTCLPASGSLFPFGTTTVTCTSVPDLLGQVGTGELLVTVLPPPPPTVTTSNVVEEAAGPNGAMANFSPTVQDSFGNSLGVTCAPLSGSLFPLGDTTATCTSDPDGFGQVGVNTLNVKVQDTTPPKFFCGEDIDAGDIGACNIKVQATGPNGASVEWDLSASDLVSGNVVVTCSLASGSLFAIGPTLVECDAKDAALNAATLKFTVTVEVVPPAPRDGCFIVNFREITYFKGQNVITSSDDGIRTKNGILVPFDPTGDRRWPYRPSGGTGYTTSRGTLFRIYGFQPAEKGQMIPDADDLSKSYPVLEDKDTKGYYIDTGGPARVIICPGQLHNYVLGGRKRYGHMDGSTRLPRLQRNVPGIMLTHNSQILRLPEHVKAEMDQLGLIHGYRGVIDYIGFQLQGNGSAPFREFVDAEVLFPGDSETDRQAHFKWGFHTATNTNFETFAGCNYVDRAPGNDAVRFRDVWVPNRSLLSYANSSWAACGSMEPAVNQKVRANYEVPFNAIQLLPTVNTNTDTLRLFYGEIRPVSRIRATAASE